ncbi:alanine racemase [Ancylobacter terrae]|uniref:alanine racemase n=1 Tax=Ancylobacter sp. sgz301288 TaxID=3342077 RepID=UPI003859C7DA
MNITAERAADDDRIGSQDADRPVLDIDLGAIDRNWARARARAAPGAIVAAVVKCDAYGLGAGRIVPRLHGLGCRDFWVAHLDEAIACAALAPGARIHVLNGLAGVDPALFRRFGLVPVLASLPDIAAAQQEARRRGPLPVAVQLDTGLNRLGLDLGEVRRLIAEPERLAGLDIRLWMSHLAFFAEPGHPENARQRRRLRAWLSRLPAAPVSLAASSGLYAGPEAHFDHIRVGSALYGVNTIRNREVGLEPVARLSAPMLRVNEVRAGAGVGYHGLYHAPARRRLATVALGYGDGVPPQLAGRGEVRVAGHPAPIVGGIAMGLMSVDVTDLPEGLAAPGRRVVLYGADPRVETVAALAGIAPNVLLTATASRAIRAYSGSGDAALRAPTPSPDAP